MNTPHPEALARLLTGSILLLAPRLAAPVLGTQRAGQHPVLRLLGARQVVQGAVTSRGLSPTGRRLSATVDALHALSCLALAWRRPSLHTPALRNAALASGFATWAVAGAAGSNKPDDSDGPS